MPYYFRSWFERCASSTLFCRLERGSVGGEFASAWTFICYALILALSPDQGSRFLFVRVLTHYPLVGLVGLAGLGIAHLAVLSVRANRETVIIRKLITAISFAAWFEFFIEFTVFGVIALGLPLIMNLILLGFAIRRVDYGPGN